VKHDLVLAGGRVIDPLSGRDCIEDIAFTQGRVSGFGIGLEGAERHDVTGAIVTPGLIDLHTHVYWGGTSLGVDADAYSAKSATTTLVDTGSAGPGNFAGFRAHVIERANTRVLVYLHVSFAGIFGFSSNIMVGESWDMRLMAAREAAEVALANKDLIIGIKVRVGHHTSGASGIAPLEIALDVADKTGLPLMAHIDEAPPRFEDVVDLLRPGDVLTHCFRPYPNSPVQSDGRVKDAVLRARKRGVLFDVGHGMGSFSWQTGQAMIAAGFPPDTISSDIHALCIDGPARDLLYTMTKFLALGMSLVDVIKAASLNPARAIRRDDLGHLTIGKTGDASIVTLKNQVIDLVDALGETVPFNKNIVPIGTIKDGKYVVAKQ
jgi:dihydroorotase|tara:strand:- start:322 stop:1455 length:1134 start_codon:yes stop_codon:yes gene_type:complete